MLICMWVISSCLSSQEGPHLLGLVVRGWATPTGRAPPGPPPTIAVLTSTPVSYSTMEFWQLVSTPFLTGVISEFKICILLFWWLNEADLKWIRNGEKSYELTTLFILWLKTITEKLISGSKKARQGTVCHRLFSIIFLLF